MKGAEAPSISPSARTPVQGTYQHCNQHRRSGDNSGIGGDMRLTSDQIKEIMRCLEESRPLPDEYRFLLFADRRDVELVWNGKTPEVCNTVLPFQIIEHVDERGRRCTGWTNKLIRGDNKLILSSLKNGPMREDIEKQGGLKLIYIDPPFDVGSDFLMNIEIGDETFAGKIAYRDSWGRGTDSFISMIYERLVLMRDLLAEDGTIYVHCDYRVNSLIRLVLNEIFGAENILNEVIWCYRQGGRATDTFGQKHETLYWFRKGRSHCFNADPVRIPYVGTGGYQTSGKGVKIGNKVYLPNELGKIPEDWWDIPALPPMSSERSGYPTQKPEALLERIIKSSSNEGDLVADFFCGSGTMAAVAEKTGRKWIACDSGKFAVHTTRKRMIGVQREMKAEARDFRAFEILSPGKYERRHYIDVHEKEAAVIDLILHAYGAAKTAGYAAFQGERAGRLVAVGPVCLPVTRLLVEEIIKECRNKNIMKADMLGFEFETGLFPAVLDQARREGIDISPRYIPSEVFDKRAVERNHLVFYDAAFIEVKAHMRKGKRGEPPALAVELENFSVFYSQDSIAGVETAGRNSGSRMVVENGQIIKVNRKDDHIVTREALTKNWADWIDYWSVDFDYGSRRDIVRMKNEETGEWEERWTGDYVFQNGWQSFRTRKDRALELKSAFCECMPGNRKIAVKVVDIFGNETATIVNVDTGAKTCSTRIAKRRISAPARTIPCT